MHQVHLKQLADPLVYKWSWLETPVHASQTQCHALGLTESFICLQGQGPTSERPSMSFKTSGASRAVAAIEGKQCKGL